LNPLKWLTLPITNENESPNLAFHCACLVVPSEIATHPKMNILKYPEIGIGRRVNTRVNQHFMILIFS